MDSVQTSQCVLVSVVIGVLLIMLGGFFYVLYIFALAPLSDNINEALKAELNVTTD
ncbi:uncharacterized protein [Drosophila kikkawai]|uniref:Protein midgut expression 1 n=1 Tax=Drosophila kikkawai TaxID=30033 RepID=A0ABM3C7S6_DROKI|nr:uncharacterized protein LOC121502882 [Drosophila kikkawai]